MPPSVRRHNLARLRDELSLTQSELSKWIGRSFSTIKAIETGTLKLSPKLATLISSLTGVDRRWLLENDPNAPLPPLRRLTATLTPEQKAYDCTVVLLFDLFSRLFAVSRRLQQGAARALLPLFIQDQLSLFEKGGFSPDAVQTHRGSVNAFEFFKVHPELLDPDLGRMINLDYLIKDAYQDERSGKRESFKLRKELTEQLKSTAREDEANLEQRAGSLPETLSPKRRKLPSRSQASPSRAGQHKTEKSS
jgi:DNA-binding XRE family transcriptional regulator